MLTELDVWLAAGTLMVLFVWWDVGHLVAGRPENTTMLTAQQLTDLKQAAAQLAIQYHHWRCEGFPTDHRYYLQVELFEALLSNLT